MHSFKPFFVFPCILAGLFFFACTADQAAVKKEHIAQKTAVEKSVTTLAIFPFDNNSVTDKASYDPLKKGLAAMLITDLSKGETGLKIIERDKIKAVLDEMALGQTSAVDEATAVKVGKILGAQSISFGSFIVLGPTVRIDARIIKTQTCEVMMADSISGKKDDFLNLVGTLSQKIASTLQVQFKPETASAESGMKAALLFSKGIEALDRGAIEEAKHYFDQSVSADGSYKDRVAKIMSVHP